MSLFFNFLLQGLFRVKKYPSPCRIALNKILLCLICLSPFVAESRPAQAKTAKQEVSTKTPSNPPKEQVKKPSVSIQKIDSWDIKIHSSEQAFSSALSGRSVVMLYRPSRPNIVFMAGDYPPMSISSIKKTVKKWKGDSKSLKTYSSKKGLVFSFRTKSQVHWFSSSGGYLLAELASPLTNKDYRELIKKVEKGDRS